MLARQLVTVTVRLFAICLMLAAAEKGLHLHLSDFQADGLLVATMWITLVMVPVTLAVVLWRFPQVVVVSPGHLQASRKDEPAIDALQLQVVGVCLIGVWLLCSALPDLIRLIVLWSSIANEHPNWSMGTEHGAQVASTVARFSLAILMIFGARGLIGLIRRLRAYGTQAQT